MAVRASVGAGHEDAILEVLQEWERLGVSAAAGAAWLKSLRFAGEFWSREWPGTARPKVYYDPRSVETDSPGGVLHAKAVVADEESVFITSANLTAAAQDRNIELGLVVRDRALAATTVTHFRTLIDGNLLRRLPDA